MVELSCRLVVPAGPGLTAIHRDSRALIDRKQHDVRLLRVDPDPVVVVPAGSTFETGKRFTTVRRFERSDVRDEHGIRVFWMDLDLRKIAAASPKPRIPINYLPAFAAVVGRVQ